VLAETGGRRSRLRPDNKAPEEKARGDYHCDGCGYQTRTGTTRTGCRGCDYVKNMITGAARWTALLVVSGKTADAAERDHILLARQVGVPGWWLFMNKADMVDDPEFSMVELEVREMRRSKISRDTIRCPRLAWPRWRARPQSSA